MRKVLRQITRDMRREIGGIALIAFGILGYLSLIVPRSGFIGRDLGHGLTLVFGIFAWVIPMLVLLSGLLRLLNRPGLADHRRGWGGVLGYFGAATALGTGNTGWGGDVGHELARLAMAALGPGGTWVVALLAVIVGGLLMTGGSLVAGTHSLAKRTSSWFGAAGKALVGGIRALRDWIYPEEIPPSAPGRSPSRPRLVVPAASEPPGVAPAQAEPAWEQFSDAPSRRVPFVGQTMTYLPPPLSLLAAPEPTRGARRGRSAQDRADILIQSLRQFGIEVRLADVSQGPTITRFEIVPPPGVKVSRIVNLTDDIALSLAATGVRIEAPIPGKSAIGIEVPNDEISPVLLREVLEHPAFTDSPSPLTVGLGRDVAGAPIVAALDQMPHLLVAGATGSGKSVLINVLISSLLFRSSPEVVRLLLIDPKVVELSVYNGIPHLLSPVVTDPKKAAGALRWAVSEMERRYRLFAEAGVRDIGRYNQSAEEHLAHVVVVIDELADLMMVAPREVEESIARLAQMARAAGLHLVVATQRPSVDVITGTIKANIPSRIAFAVSSQVDSRTILDAAGAEKLLGRGDMLFDPVGAPKPLRIQGAFVDEREIEELVGYLKQQAAPLAQEPLEFSDGDESVAIANETDTLFESAVRIVVESGQASTSMLQRRLRVGYTRAARLIDAMEERGFIGPSEGAKARDVRLSPEQLERVFGPPA
ncbi:MAG: DNA translocase FtsK [Thermaerobacter sp.]|nr:DNA translocase FtsK [Thermaerobacter sp.]